jgi:outer membrane murein-binding lipoprotein Lpp
MKISELLEEKVEMCPDACCGKPVTECKCGPDCKHCDCYSKNKMNEAAPSGEDMLAKVDMLLQNTGIKRKGFQLIKDPAAQGSVRGSITQDAINNIKATLAKAKAMGASEPATVKPTMNPADVPDSAFAETTSAGSVASSMGSGNGFVNGGIGTLSRNGPTKKRKKKQN